MSPAFVSMIGSAVSEPPPRSALSLAARELELSGPVEVGAELGEGGQLAVLGEVEA